MSEPAPADPTIVTLAAPDPMVERARALQVAAWFVKPVDLVALRNALRQALP